MRIPARSFRYSKQMCAVLPLPPELSLKATGRARGREGARARTRMSVLPPGVNGTLRCAGLR